MTSLREVAGFWPETRIPVREILRKNDLSPARIKLYEKYFGFHEVRVTEKADPALQLLCAAERLRDLKGNEHRVRFVLQARTMPVATPYATSPVHEVRDRLGLRRARACCVTQHACASGLLAVELAGRLLAADGDPEALALVLTGEKAFTAGARVIPGTAVMGECAAAALVGLDGPRDRVLSYATQTRGEFEGRMPQSTDIAAFQDAYPGALADVVRAAVAGAGLDVSDIDLFLPHNVNRMSWLPVLRRLGLPGKDRLFLENLPKIGHCFGADTFLNYLTARDKGALRPGRRYVMTSVGIGATFSAMVFEH